MVMSILLLFSLLFSTKKFAYIPIMVFCITILIVLSEIVSLLHDRKWKKAIIALLRFIIIIPLTIYFFIGIFVGIYSTIVIPVSMKSTVLKGIRYEIKHKNFCFNSCYSVYECNSYEDKCYEGYSSYLIYDADKIIDIYIKNNNLHVVFKRENANFKIMPPYKCKKVDDGNIFEECISKREKYATKTYLDNYVDVIKLESEVGMKNNGGF